MYSQKFLAHHLDERFKCGPILLRDHVKIGRVEAGCSRRVGGICKPLVSQSFKCGKDAPRASGNEVAPQVGE